MRETNPEEFDMNEHMASPSPLSVTITSGVRRAGPSWRVGYDSFSPAVSCSGLAASKSKRLRFKNCDDKILRTRYVAERQFVRSPKTKTRIQSFVALRLPTARNRYDAARSKNSCSYKHGR
jgi:hypothetical protein